MNMFEKDPGTVDFRENAIAVIERPLPPEWIEQREVAGVTLSYIGGENVIRLMNEAFQYRWGFEILEEKILPVAPKPVMAWQDKRKVPVLNADGTVKTEDQPSVFQVKGRLTVPGFGIREQYGSKILVGGASEQESAGKSAATDCLKKCASLFGFALELYDRKPVTSPISYGKTPSSPRPPATVKPTPITDVWATKGQDVRKLKEYKTILGVSDNAQLDPYVRDFLKKPEATFENIIPDNITAFNQYLAPFTEKV